MIGKQLLDDGKLYARSEIEKLPESFRKTITVRALQRKGALNKDKRVGEKMKQLEEAKRRNGRAEVLTLEQLKEKAKSTPLDNDVTWENPDTVQYKKDVERLCSYGFWNGLKKDDLFYLLDEGVLTQYFVRDENKKTKKAILVDIKAYLEKVACIVEGGHNDLSTTDFSRLDKIGILTSFVVYEKAIEFVTKQRGQSLQQQQDTTALLDFFCVQSESNWTGNSDNSSSNNNRDDEDSGDDDNDGADYYDDEDDDGGDYNTADDDNFD